MPASRGPGRPRPFIYALSLAIYCTSWTFFGSVGLASERGLEFLAIYIGPLLVFVFGFPLLSRIIRLAKAEKITSIADFLGARYGKSFAVASIATLIATVGAIPYIALQLKAISGSVSLMVEHYTGAPPSFDPFVSDISLIVAVLLALFAVLFGTRHADATEHQNGLVLAVAVESVVKLVAFLAVGLFVTFVPVRRPRQHVRRASPPTSRSATPWATGTSLGTWLVLTVHQRLRHHHAAAPVLRDDRGKPQRKRTAHRDLGVSALSGGDQPVRAADRLRRPVARRHRRPAAISTCCRCRCSAGHDLLAMVAFIGGLSAATAMVIVASVALSIMISNDLVIPIFVRRLLKIESDDTEDWSETHPQHPPRLDLHHPVCRLPLLSREHQQCAAGLDRPDVVRGHRAVRAVLHRRPHLAPRQCAGCGTRHDGRHRSSGPTRCCCPRSPHPIPSILVDGLFGIEALRPQALFGTVAEPLNHGVLWSLSINTLFFVFGSLSRASVPLERIQASIFVPRDAEPDAEPAPFPHGHHRQRPQGHHLPLSRRRAHRAFVPDLRGRRAAAS